MGLFIIYIALIFEKNKKMLTSSKKSKLLAALKLYHKKFMNGSLVDLDESGTRLMINSVLTDVLGYAPIEEVKTEYMIRGTYADYVIQLKGQRHFLVEVKSLSLTLSDKHLRQAVNYGANEGIEWALLTNGKQFLLYKILFGKPIESRLVFSIDLSDKSSLKACAEDLQYLHKDSVISKGLDKLWNRTIALDPKNVAGFLYLSPISGFIRRTLNKRFKHKFSESDIENAIDRIVKEEIQIDDVKSIRLRSKRKSK